MRYKNEAYAGNLKGQAVTVLVSGEGNIKNIILTLLL